MLESLDYSPLPLQPTIVSEPDAVEQRLLSLHETLLPEVFLESNLRGYEARVEVTPSHPPTAAGTLHWHAFVGALRFALAEQGWSTYNHKNCPFVLSPDSRTSIVVMTGNSDTGKLYGNPTNQAEKGVVLGAAVIRNAQLQLNLSRRAGASGAVREGTQVWVLLYHVELGIKGVLEIRSELSLPSVFQKRKIESWTERIILRPIRPDYDTQLLEPLPSQPFDVSVERKTAT